jgi:hypothetical protein
MYLVLNVHISSTFNENLNKIKETIHSMEKWGPLLLEEV